MKKNYVIVAGLLAVAGAFWYYRKRSAEIAKSHQNPNESQDSSLGAQAGNYDRSTGPIGDTRTSNYRYNEYLDYLKVGGRNSGKTFDQYLTAAQGQSLPTNS